jgi:THO complex subunit 1
LQALTTHTTPQAIAAAIQTHVFTEDPDKLLPTSARELLSHALQASVIHLVSSAAVANQPSLQYSLPTTTNTQPALPSLLEASLVFCASGDTKDLALIQLPSLLVELISEASPAVQFEDLLSWLHSQLHTFQAPPYVDRSKLPMLRTCNMLLRRLSKGANASLSGRILMFLAKFLSLTERSGVNLKGEYNTSNKTPIEQLTTTITDKEEEEGDEEKKEKKASDTGNGDKKKKRKHQDTENVTTDGEGVPLDAEGNPVDKEFYQTFWRLQDAFSNPPSVLSSNEKWSQVAESIRKTLQHFRKEKVTVGEGSHSHNNSAGTGNGQQQQQQQQQIVSLGIKYLSSARLMSLQFKEAAFRRHIIVQALILFHYLEKPYMKNPPPPRPKSTGSGGGGDKKGEGDAKGEDTGDGGAKEQQDPAKAGGLSGRQLNELRELKNSLLAELDATPDNGAAFTSSIQHLLRAEDHWAAWKQANCPADPLQRKPIPSLKDSDLDGTEVGPIRKKRRPSSHLQAYGIRVGTEDLDRLWNLTEDNMTSLGADDRGGFKTVAQLIEPVIDEMKEGGDGEDSMFGGGGNSGIYAWKTLRFVARDQLTAFVKTVQKGGDLRVAARALFPDECPPEPEPVVVVVEEKEKEKEEEEEAKEEKERKGDEEEGEDVVMVPALGGVEKGGRGKKDNKKEDGVDDDDQEEEVDYGDDDDDEGGKERGGEEEERKEEEEEEEEEKEGGEVGEHSGEDMDMDVDTDHKVQEGNDNDNDNDKDKERDEGEISNKEKDEKEEKGALKSKGSGSGNTTRSSSDDEEEGEVN